MDVSPTFRKAEIVIETVEQYPQVIKFELHQDNCRLIEGKQIGQMVDIKFDIRGKEYNHPQKRNSNFQHVSSLASKCITIKN